MTGQGTAEPLRPGTAASVQPAPAPAPAYKSRSLRGLAFLGAAAAVTILGNVAFHITVARSGGPSGYGVAGTLLSFGAVAAVLGSGVQYAVARHTARSEGTPLYELVAGARSLAPALALLACSLAVAAPLSTYLHLAGILPVFDAITYFGATLLVAVPTGVLVGQERFGSFATLTVIGVAARLTLAIVVWGTNETSNQAVAASSAATVLVALLAAAVVALRSPATSADRRRPPVREEHRPLALESAGGILLGAGIAVTWMLPLFFARHYLPSQLAGRFSAAQVSATAVLFLAAPVTTAFFPSIARSRSRRPVLAGLGGTLVVCTLGALGLVSLGPVVLPLLYGPAYQMSPGVFGALGGSVAIAALATYGLWATRARRGNGGGMAAGVVVALLAESLLGAVWHQDLTALALGPGVAMALGAAVALPRLLAGRRPAPALATPATTTAGAGPGLPVDLLRPMVVGVMAHNEAGTIRPCVESILAEGGPGRLFPSVVVVVSGSTDGTDLVVSELAARDRRVRVIVEPGRSGKASAINTFLAATKQPMCVLASGDTLLAPGSLRSMAAALARPGVGMCGGRIVPQNAAAGLTNRLVHLLWELHNEVSLIRPKLGEVVAFRRLFDRIDPRMSSDEVCVEKLVQAAGYELHMVPEAVVFNRGPVQLADYVNHRLRCHRGHLAIRSSHDYTASTLAWTPVAAACARYLRSYPARAPLLVAAATVEAWARLRARAEHLRDPHADVSVWEPVHSAKQPIAAGNSYLDLRRQRPGAP